MEIILSELQRAVDQCIGKINEELSPTVIKGFPFGSVVYLCSEQRTEIQCIDDIDFVLFIQQRVEKSTRQRLPGMFKEAIQAKYRPVRGLKTRPKIYDNEDKYRAYLRKVTRHNARVLGKGLVYWKNPDGEKYSVPISTVDHRVKSLKKYIEVLLLTKGITPEFIKWRDLYLSLSKTSDDLKELLANVTASSKLSESDCKKENWKPYYESYEDILKDMGCPPDVRML